MGRYKLYESQNGIPLGSISEGDYIDFIPRLTGKVSMVNESKVYVDLIMPSRGEVFTPFIRNSMCFSNLEGGILYPNSRCSRVVCESIGKKEFEKMQEIESALVKHLKLENGEGERKIK